jgi:uridylate kinase
MKKSSFIVLSLGGSLIVPDEIDIEFLRTFRALLRQEVRRGFRFVIFTGGGKVCRRYQEAARTLGKPTNDALDWIGIRSTHLNGELVRAMFADLMTTDLLTSPYGRLPNAASVMIGVGGGYRPGESSDGPAVTVAKRLGASLVINLTNIPYVYDRDPRKVPDAKELSDLTWSAYLTLIDQTRTPGMNAPFDPVASRRARRAGISVAICDGRDLKNVRKIIHHQSFRGTLIHP